MGDMVGLAELFGILNDKEKRDAYLEEHRVMDLYGAYRFGQTGIGGNGAEWIREFRALPESEQGAWRMVYDLVKSMIRQETYKAKSENDDGR